MIRIETKTKLSPEAAIKKAVDFFGPGALGLKVKNQSANGAGFEGGGGYIEITTRIEEKKTAVELVAQEWEFQAREFVNQISS